MKARIVVIIFIIIGLVSLISFLIHFLFIRRIKSKKILLIIYGPIFLITLVFFLTIYMPRGINRRYLKDDPVAIYYTYINKDYPYGNIVEISDEKKGDIYKELKKCYYVPCYHVVRDKTDRSIANYFCIQYETYYIVIGECHWEKVDGEFTEYKIFNSDYSFNQKTQGTTKKMKNFDFDYLKSLVE